MINFLNWTELRQELKQFKLTGIMQESGGQYACSTEGREN